MRPLPLSVCGLLALIPTTTTLASDPFADAVMHFDAGTDAEPAYGDATVTLGSPERYTGEGVFPGVVSFFNPPFGPDEIVSIGRGGELIVRFDEPVTDDAANPFGLDLLVFGNAGFIDTAYPGGIVGGIFGGDGGAVDVSTDGVTWIAVPGVAADGLFPTLGYLDAGPYDAEPGALPTDFTRPVDPSVTLDTLDGLPFETVRDLYGGAGGGVGIDLASVGLASVSYVRVRNPIDAKSAIEIDAFSDVAASIAGDVTGDGLVNFDDLLALLSTWGPCPGGCPADLDGNASVDFGDLLIVLTNWSA